MLGAPSLEFTRVDHDEPHLRRRRKILTEHPEIRKLHGYDPKEGWTALVVLAAHLGLGLAVQFYPAIYFNHWAGFLFLAYSVGAVFNHWLGQVIHEGSHNLLARRPWQNRLLSYLVNLPMIFPIAETFRRYHIDHHTMLGIEGEDTDLPFAIENKIIGNNRALKFIWLFFYALVYSVRGAFFVKPMNRWEWLNLATQTAFTVSWIAFIGWQSALFYLVSLIFGHSLHPVAAHFIHEHYIFHPGQETYSYYGPLNRVTFNVGYHVEHHDFMNVPGSRLPELHRIAAEHYQPLKSHRSWTWVLWHFIWDKRMGPHQRMVRSRAAHDTARRNLRAQSLA